MFWFLVSPSRKRRTKNGKKKKTAAVSRAFFLRSFILLTSSLRLPLSNANNTQKIRTVELDGKVVKLQIVSFKYLFYPFPFCRRCSSFRPDDPSSLLSLTLFPLPFFPRFPLSLSLPLSPPLSLSGTPPARSASAQSPAPTTAARTASS